MEEGTVGDGAGVVQDSCLRFRIPSLPASMNAIYQIMFHLKQVQMKPEVRAWKTQAKQFVPKWTLPAKVETGFLYLKLVYHGDWFYKNGKARRIDLPNLQKITVDVIAEKLGFDDCMVWAVELKKVQDAKDFVDCELGFISDMACGTVDTNKGEGGV